MSTENGPQPRPPRPRRYYPLLELVFARLREFYREPEAIFWVYGFPILMMVALGIAFWSKPITVIKLIIENGPGAEAVKERLSHAEDPKFEARILDAEAARLKLRTGKTELLVVPPSPGSKGYEYLYDPTRPESMLARYAVNEVLQGDANRIPVREQRLEEQGGRYIDFLVPGLLGMSLMGGGLWGVGFVTVDMRIRKLLKRFLATPMRRRDFLLGLMISRLIFMVPEVLLMLLFGWLVFGVEIRGSVLDLTVLILVGAFTFSGLGLLVASRAKTLEAVSGLMNLVMLPMWLLSGIFFSSERFPEVAQPFIKVLPLTPLIDSLRAIMLEGASLASQWPQLAILAGYGIVSFVVALRIFRWN
jgi:ABC-type multidrug transport system permease subunit